MVKKIYLDDPDKGGQPNWLHQHRLDKEKKVQMKYDEKYYLYLDKLRESGIINMFGAVPYLLNQFHGLDWPLAKKILADWMKTFGERHPKREGENG